MKMIANSPLLFGMVVVGLLYIVGLALLFLKKAYTRCIELGITKETLSKVIRSSLVFSIVPSLSIVVGLFVLIAVFGVIWPWWRLSVIGSLSYETMISSSIASALGFSSSADLMTAGTAEQFGVVLILMSVGMMSGFLVLIPFGKKLCMSVTKKEGGSDWSYVFCGVFMMTLFAVYIPVLLIGDSMQAAVMLTGLVVAVGLGILSKKPGFAWVSDFIMAITMIVGMASSLFWIRIFG